MKFAILAPGHIAQSMAKAVLLRFYYKSKKVPQNNVSVIRIDGFLWHKLGS